MNKHHALAYAGIAAIIAAFLVYFLYEHAIVTPGSSGGGLLGGGRPGAAPDHDKIQTGINNLLADKTYLNSVNAQPGNTDTHQKIVFGNMQQWYGFKYGSEPYTGYNYPGVVGDGTYTDPANQKTSSGSNVGDSIAAAAKVGATVAALA